MIHPKDCLKRLVRKVNRVKIVFLELMYDVILKEFDLLNLSFC